MSFKDKEKKKEYDKQWQKNNPGKTKERDKRYYYKHREKRLAKNKKWRESHPEYRKNYYLENGERRKEQAKIYFLKNRYKIYEYKKTWKKTEKGKAYDQRNCCKRRMRNKEIINTLTAQEWLDILKEHKYKCFYCGKEFDLFNRPTRDHKIPISKGGNNTKENIVPACRSCNSRKWNKILI